jgi:hypothetical protein
MFLPPMHLNKILSGILFLSFSAQPAIAHEVKVSGNVAATFHLEPDHNPKAGQPSQVWFALTQKGGKIIPLEQCNCKLTVRSEPHIEGSEPLLEPLLKAISAEQYQGIPGTEIVFPKPGAYELELSGTPKAGASFQPFELPYTVTVGAGGAPETSRTSSPDAIHDRSEQQHITTEKSESSQSIPQWQIPAAIGVILGGVGAITVWLGRSKR